MRHRLELHVVLPWASVTSRAVAMLLACVCASCGGNTDGATAGAGGEPDRDGSAVSDGDAESKGDACELGDVDQGSFLACPGWSIPGADCSRGHDGVGCFAECKDDFNDVWRADCAEGQCTCSYNGVAKCTCKYCGECGSCCRGL